MNRALRNPTLLLARCRSVFNQSLHQWEVGLSSLPRLSTCLHPATQFPRIQVAVQGPARLFASVPQGDGPVTRAAASLADHQDGGGYSAREGGQGAGPPKNKGKPGTAKLTPMMEQYHRLKNEHPGFLLLYRMGDFYEMFYEDAETASRVLNITLTKRGKVNGVEVPMAGIPYHALDSYLGRLIRNGCLVAVVEQLVDPTPPGGVRKGRPKKAGTVLDREVKRLVTPGTLVEDNLLPPRANNFLLSIHSDPSPDPHNVDRRPFENETQFGLSWIDLSTGEFHVALSDGDNLATDVARISPVEVIVAPDLLEVLQQDNMCAMVLSGIHCTPALPHLISARASMRDLLAGYHSAYSDTSKFSKLQEVASDILLRYVATTQKGKIPHILPPTHSSSSQTMILSPTTRKSLELHETLRGETKGSLLSVVDNTVTSAGARLMSSHLASPLVSATEIDNRLDVVDYLHRRPDTITDLRRVLRRCYDVERALQRLTLAKGGPRDLLALGRSLTEATELARCLDNGMGRTTRKDSPVERPLRLQNCYLELGDPEHVTLADELSAAIDENSPLMSSNGGFIKVGYDPEFDRLVELRDHGHLKLKELQARYREETGVTGLKIRMNFLLGYFVEITSASAAKVVMPPHFNPCQQTATSHRFKTQEIADLERDITTAANRTLVAELDIFERLAQQVVSRAQEISRVGRAMAALDVWCSHAYTANQYGYTRPVVTNRSSAFLVQRGRHAIVEASQASNVTGGTFVGNDLHLDDDTRAWLITGPNMGGKSTFLRQTALIAIMGQIGSFVPADAAEFGVVDRVFTRIGAADDLANDQSTFMTEMVETAEILRDATDRSLVIVDELGRGTSSSDGLAIAWAVLERVLQFHKCRTLFATHYHELAIIEKEFPVMKCFNMDVIKHENHITFTHKVIPGITTDSCGLYVARLGGVPPEVLSRAGEISSALEDSRSAAAEPLLINKKKD